MMKFIPIAFGAVMLATAASAQTTSNAPNSSDSPGVTSNSPMAGMKQNGGNKPGGGMLNHDSGSSAASGNDNQAITTTGKNAKHPAHGSNSFTKGQAQGRIKHAGFSKVSSLHMDHHGVWRGKGVKNGQPVQVWLDYKGNVGSNG